MKTKLNQGHVGEMVIERSRPVKRVRIRYEKDSDFTMRHTLTERKWTEHGRVELQINSVALFNALADRAIKSKSGRATALHGMIKAIVRERIESNVTEVNHPIPDGYEFVADLDNR